ncbi:MAG: TldD/PmbA family protein [Brevinema sp.]
MMKDKALSVLQNVEAESVEINTQHTVGASVTISNGEVEQISNSDTISASVRMFDHGATGFASFNDGDFASAVDRVKESVHILGQGARHLVPASKIVDSIENPMLKNPWEMSLEEKYHYAQKMYDLLKDPAFTSSRVTFTHHTKDKNYLNNSGSDIHQKKHFLGMSVAASIAAEGTLQTAYVSRGTYGGLEILDGIEEDVEIVKKRVRDLVKAPKVEGGTYKVLLDPDLAGVFAHEAFGHMSEGDFLADNPDVLAKIKIGARLGVEELNITDDGRQNNLCGWCAYDDEGVPAQRRELIKEGRVNAYLHSRLTAYEMGQSPTGNGRALSPFYSPIPRMTNTYIENGSKSFEQLLEELGDGIYACGSLGGMTNLETFTFTAAYAYQVEGGRIKQMIRDVVLSGNLFTTLNNIIGIGNDLRHLGGLGGCGKAGQNGLPVSTGSPSLLIKDVLIG